MSRPSSWLDLELDSTGFGPYHQAEYYKVYLRFRVRSGAEAVDGLDCEVNMMPEDARRLARELLRHADEADAKQKNIDAEMFPDKE